LLSEDGRLYPMSQELAKPTEQSFPQVSLSLEQFASMQKVLPPSSAPQTKNSIALVSLVMLFGGIILFGGGYGVHEWQDYQQLQVANTGVSPDGFLTVPDVVKIEAGARPYLLRGETNGKVVEFIPPENEAIQVQKTGPKEAMVWTDKTFSGEFTMVAVSAKNSLLLFQPVRVVVAAPTKKEEKAKKKDGEK
jgi:hypothetical protein